MACVPQSPAHIICQSVAENESVTQKPRLKSEVMGLAYTGAWGLVQEGSGKFISKIMAVGKVFLRTP